MINTAEVAAMVWAEHSDAMRGDLLIAKKPTASSDTLRPQRTIDAKSHDRWWVIIVDRKTGEARCEYSPPAKPYQPTRRTNRA